jgi:hypothetical protein
VYIGILDKIIYMQPRISLNRNIEKKPWAKHFDFAMLCTWSVLNLVFAIIAFVWFGQDFRGYYAAARVLITGGNPYDYDLVARVLLE